MTAYNLAVCLTPNLFHTKHNAKNVQQQTEAIEICINNVNNIGKTCRLPAPCSLVEHRRNVQSSY